MAEGSARRDVGLHQGISGADGGGDLLGFFGGEKEFDEAEAEIEGSAGAAGCQDMAVENDAFVGENVGKLGADGRVCGVAAVGEEAGVVEDGGRGADGGDEATGGVVAEDDGADARVGAKVFCAGTAGEENGVEVVGFDGGEGGVGVESEVGASAGDVDRFAECGEGDVGAGAAQDVDRGDGLDFFKSLGEDCENGGHEKN